MLKNRVPGVFLILLLSFSCKSKQKNADTNASSVGGESSGTSGDTEIDASGTLFASIVARVEASKYTPTAKELMEESVRLGGGPEQVNVIELASSGVELATASRPRYVLATNTSKGHEYIGIFQNFNSPTDAPVHLESLAWDVAKGQFQTLVYSYGNGRLLHGASSGGVACLQCHYNAVPQLPDDRYLDTDAKALYGNLAKFRNILTGSETQANYRMRCNNVCGDGDSSLECRKELATQFLDKNYSIPVVSNEALSGFPQIKARSNFGTVRTISQGYYGTSKAFVDAKFPEPASNPEGAKASCVGLNVEDVELVKNITDDELTSMKNKVAEMNVWDASAFRRALPGFGEKTPSSGAELSTKLKAHYEPIGSNRQSLAKKLAELSNPTLSPQFQEILVDLDTSCGTCHSAMPTRKGIYSPNWFPLLRAGFPRGTYQTKAVSSVEPLDTFLKSSKHGAFMADERPELVGYLSPEENFAMDAANKKLQKWFSQGSGSQFLEKTLPEGTREKRGVELELDKERLADQNVAAVRDLDACVETIAKDSYKDSSTGVFEYRATQCKRFCEARVRTIASDVRYRCPKNLYIDNDEQNSAFFAICRSVCDNSGVRPR